MANEEHVWILKQGAKAWDPWREDNPGGGANMFEVNLYRSYLTGGYLIGADLRGADLSGVYLTRADLSGADLSGADLSGAKLIEVYLSGTYLIGADLTETNLSGAKLADAKLADAKLAKAKLTKANLIGADLRGIDFTEADLRGADLTETNLSGAKLADANLADAKFTRAKLTKADLRGSNLRGAALRGADLSRGDLRGANLRGAALRGANFTEADLSRGDLRGANLRGAALRGADLSGADLSRAHFQGANLTGASLKNVTFADSFGHSVNLANANLSGVRFTSIDESNPHSGFLDLASAKGLETADFGTPDFLVGYIEKAFKYAHQPNLEEAERWPNFVEKAIKNIKLLRSIAQSQDQPPTQLVEVVSTITDELIQYLKRHPEALREVQPRQFEELIGEILASYGWEVQLTPPTRDGGYDLFAISKDPKADVQTSWVIECKKYKEDRGVGVDIVRGLWGVKQDLRVANAMLATTSYFTKGVKDFKASRYDLELRDYEGIIEWVNQYQPNPDGKLYIKDNQLVLPGEE